MLTARQREDFETFFSKHADSILWAGDAAEFVSTPTPLTQSIVIAALNTPQTWQLAARLVECPLPFHFQHQYIHVLLHHSYADLEVEAEMFGLGKNTWQVSDAFTKPTQNTPWYSAMLKPRYLMWQAQLLQPQPAHKILDQLKPKAETFFQKTNNSQPVPMASAIREFSEGISFVLAIGLLDGFYQQYLEHSLKKKYQKVWSEIEAWLSQQIKEQDHYFQSIHQLSLIASDQKKVATYVAQFGNRAFDDYELMSPRFHEQPEKIKKISQTAELPQIATENFSHLPKVVRAQDAEILKLASHCKALRGTWRLQLLSNINRIRHVALEIATKHAFSGNEIFFFTQEEILQTGVTLDPQVAVQRKKTYEEDIATTLPPLIVGKELEKFFNPESTPSHDVKLHVLPVSTGQVMGKLFEITSEDQSHIPTGSILILPDSSARWSHFYTQSVGLIFRQGGMMSHGAIVAREYRIPAVSLSGKQLPFTSGQVVTLDAAAGAIILTDSTFS